MSVRSVSRSRIGSRIYANNARQQTQERFGFKTLPSHPSMFSTLLTLLLTESSHQLFDMKELWNVP